MSSDDPDDYLDADLSLEDILESLVGMTIAGVEIDGEDEVISFNLGDGKLLEVGGSEMYIRRAVEDEPIVH